MDLLMDHGGTLITFILFVCAIAGMVYRQAGRDAALKSDVKAIDTKLDRVVGTIKTEINNINKAQDLKIDKNCRALVHLVEEVQSLKDSKLLTHPDHFKLTVACRKELDKEMDSQKELINKDVKSVVETMYEMRMEMKEERKVRQKQSEKLVEYDVILHGFREDLKLLRA